MKIQAFDSIRVRLTLWYVGVLALALIAFSIVVYTLLSRVLYQRIDNDLLSLAAVTIKSLNNDTEEGQSSVGAAQSTVAEMTNPQQGMAVFDGSGKLLAQSHVDDDFEPVLPEAGLISDHEVYLYTASEPGDDDRHRIAVQRAVIPLADTPFIVLINQPLEAVEEEMESLREILYYAVPFALAIAALGGWFLARKSLAPVAAMSERARRIGTGNLDQKLPVANPRDELGHLAVTFNELLSRLDAAFVQQRQFMADASHELRTPLSVMHITAGVTLEQPQRQEDEYREAIKMMDGQTMRLTRIVEDMFMLARADSGRYPLRKRQFYLDELIEEVASFARVLASRKAITLDVKNASESPFYGDEDLLRQMIQNLLDNAIKYTPPEGTVRLRLWRAQQDYHIEVADTGTGILAEVQTRIFERFYRASRARSRAEQAQGSGAGLGLAIARWVAQSHGGSLQLAHSDQNGSTFVIRLPVADSR